MTSKRDCVCGHEVEAHTLGAGRCIAVGFSCPCSSFREQLYPTHYSHDCYPPVACMRHKPEDGFASVHDLVDCHDCRIIIGLDPAPGDRFDTGEEHAVKRTFPDVVGGATTYNAGRVISLADRRLEPVPAVVEQLEQALERARRGEIRGLAIAATVPSGRWTSAYVIGDTGLPALNLAVDLLKSRLLANPTE